MLVGSFNQVNALVEAFLKTDGLFATLLSSVHTSATLGTALITALRGELKIIKIISLFLPLFTFRWIHSSAWNTQVKSLKKPHKNLGCWFSVSGWERNSFKVLLLLCDLQCQCSGSKSALPIKTICKVQSGIKKQNFN